jgi:hypothetical protein
VYRQPYGETWAIWTQGGDSFGRVTSQDTVAGRDGRSRVSDQATIWRWRTAFQHEFAARMDWSVSDYAHANHNPSVVVNGAGGTAVLRMDMLVGQSVTLDAGESRDPGGQWLCFRWIHYAEAGFAPGAILAAVNISGSDSAKATVTATATSRPNWLGQVRSSPTGIAHIVLAVTDGGSLSLTSYRRIILTVRARAGSER